MLKKRVRITNPSLAFNYLPVSSLIALFSFRGLKSNELDFSQVSFLQAIILDIVIIVLIPYFNRNSLFYFLGFSFQIKSLESVLLLLLSLSLSLSIYIYIYVCVCVCVRVNTNLL